MPVPSRDPPAPATITYLIKCGRKQTSCRSHCSCRPQRLKCSEMCVCGAADKVCDDVSQELSSIDDDHNDDDDDDDDDDGDPSV